MTLFNNLSTLFNAKNAQKAPIIKKISKPHTPTPSKPKIIAPTIKPSAKPDPKFLNELNNLKREAVAQAKEIVVEAKGEALSIRSQAEKEAQKIIYQAEEQQRVLSQKLDRIDLRLSQMDQKE